MTAFQFKIVFPSQPKHSASIFPHFSREGVELGERIDATSSFISSHVPVCTIFITQQGDKPAGWHSAAFQIFWFMIHGESQQ